MDWLEHDSCNESCDEDNILSTIKNIRFSTKDTRVYPIDFEKYKYGKACTEDYEDLVSNECD